MKNVRKTDRRYEKEKVEKLFLKCLGMSPRPLSISEIEDAVEKFNPGSRQNYVYEVKKRLHHDSSYIPSRLLFKESDFLIKEGKEFRLDSEGFRDEAFEAYKHYFNCESGYELNVVTPEKENENQDKIKCIQISDNKNNYVRVEINFTLLEIKGKLEKGMVKFFQKSKFSDLENELNLHHGREKGRFIVRKLKMITNYSFLDYIDVVSFQNADNKYVLNLKGLLHLILLYKGKLDVFSFEKIISNVSNLDEYMNLRDEIDSAYGSNYNIENIDDENSDIRKTYGSNSSHQIKKRFPFLSFYSGYRDYIHSENESFISDFLFDVVKDFERQLLNMSITKLKYEVTKRYLERIRKYFYSFHTQRLLHTNLSSNTFQAITRLQNEIGIYVEEMKRSDYEWEKLERQWYEEQYVNIEFERKFNTLTNSDANVISLKEILP
ncbi:MAG TPA: hypothetical protein VFV86_08125, partial [Nitrososphaeraceae archaeon]|nr:hypothetical protein [Nitrososphaeraceae archaeon]